MCVFAQFQALEGISQKMGPDSPWDFFQQKLNIAVHYQPIPARSLALFLKIIKKQTRNTEKKQEIHLSR